ncbi:hypothetical protein DH2020_047425 [Rehmannia glutinosa]|uniref:FAD-binding domain-containing protein n=1 Tax=Rehmannia glutinosa TaxID=99300 RepID=A0ABR0U8K1_REHGL
MSTISSPLLLGWTPTSLSDGHSLKLGVRSLVLESSDSLRLTGYALTLWPNGWRALDAVGVGDNLREKSVRIIGYKVASQDTKVPTSEADVNLRKLEIRCVRRKDLLESLEKELPQGTIRYSSKVVSIEESAKFKLIYLADGSLVRTKVLIGCDGVNSKVANWLALESPVSAGGRSSIRGIVEYPDGHVFEPKVHTYIGGVLAMHQRVLDVVERTELDCISYAAIKYRSPWNVLLGNIVKDNVCVAGDALHPMPPYTSQGGGSALEDGVILARCLSEALLTKQRGNMKETDDEDYVKMENGLKRYSQERKWRSFSLISIAYVVGWIQGSDSKVMGFLRKKFLARFTLGTMVRMAQFDCGKLVFT